MSNPKFLNIEKKIPYSVRLPQRLIDKLNAYAELNGNTTTNIINNILNDFISDKVIMNDYLDNTGGVAVKIPYAINQKNMIINNFENLTENNTFEYKGHGIVNHGGHLNSMCCRVEDKTTGKQATSDTQSSNKVVCIYSSCATAGSRNVPPTPSNGTAISVYGGGRIQIGRIPIIKQVANNVDTYSIPTTNTFAQLVMAGDYGHYQDPGDTDRYNRITYFCGVNADVQSQKRTMMRMTYDSDIDVFYIESSKLGAVQTY